MSGLMGTAARQLQTLLRTVEPAVQIGAWTTANPDRAVALTIYPSEDDADTGTVLFAAQIRFRGATSDGSLAMLDRQDAVFDLLAMRRPVIETPDLTVVLAWRQIAAPLGLDAQGRPEIADTYYCRTDRLGLYG